ncbi:MAG: aminoacyl-tRNA hydrolase [Polaromonas sp.]|uniref:aminoacyl-tRNA hydrolase n=1 Tax=Polaromonas sp. TaxID=1869339 RepID=UPI00272F7B3F|nr:aminoacyl-tRNA hydrolase [Polaromonas sp.]MDP2256498.1 aminoacyl-tRNA hydrolase [Polaromonas sp.]MDP3709570.1 aminoacyl-tRNA hydrolase [Polaromonas sp.]
MIKLFVGLGNPGAEYEATRHNAGFWWIDALSQELKVPLSLDKNYFGQVGRTTLNGQNVWLLKPLTFMNLSGKSVAALARFFKIAPGEILVAHDELDIVPGQAKLKLGGSHAGHNGLRDIHAQLGTPDYWRLRIGVGHPGVKSEVISWVLKKPSAEHRTAIEDCIARSIKAAPELLKGDMDKATMLIHTSQPPRPKPPRPVAVQAVQSPAATSEPSSAAGSNPDTRQPKSA